MPDTGISVFHVCFLILGIALQGEFYYSHFIYEEITLRKNKWFPKEKQTMRHSLPSNEEVWQGEGWDEQREECLLEQ